MDKKVICPYCQQPAVLQSSKKVYNGQDYGPIWHCQPCGAWVGCHPGTNNPLGSLANAELRRWRWRAHLHFDTLWKNKGIMTRTQAYEWLQNITRLSPEEAHIGKFDARECKRLVGVMKTMRGTKCLHKKTRTIDWPDGGAVELCLKCGFSRYIWEQGESGWKYIADLESAKKELAESIEKIVSDVKKVEKVKDARKKEK